MRYAVPVLLLLLVASCAKTERASVTDLQKREGLSAFQMVALHGARNGDRLNAQAIFSDSSSILTVELHFVIGAPSRLDAGTWSWARAQATGGSVQARSVLFLGGQDGLPSIGGTFDLVDGAGAARYRVTIPATEVRAR